MENDKVDFGHVKYIRHISVADSCNMCLKLEREKTETDLKKNCLSD